MPAAFVLSTRNSAEWIEQKDLMPRYKPSKGEVIINVVFSTSFRDWLRTELDNIREWNTRVKWVSSGPYVYQCAQPNWSWKIETTNQGIHVTSDLPRIHLRKGLYIDMSRGQLVVG